MTVRQTIRETLAVWAGVGLTSAQIARETGKTRQRVVRVLTIMVKAGEVERFRKKNRITARVQKKGNLPCPSYYYRLARTPTPSATSDSHR